MPASAARLHTHDAYDTAHASLRRQVLRECEEMAEYAFASGMRVPARTMQVVEGAVAASRDGGNGDAPYDATGQEIARLAAAHEQLARVVAPATPRALVILADHRNDGSWLGFLGPVPFIRRMMIAAIASLLAFITLAATPGIDGNAVIGVRETSARVLGNMAFLLSAAALGASFASLFTASKFINGRTWDPQHEITYWIKFIVGLMAGLMLSLMIPLELGTHGADGVEGTMAVYDKPLLSLLGGFSADLVHRVLSRLVETVESLVRGSTRELLTAAEERARIRARAQTDELRLQMASELMALRQLAADGDAATLRRRLDSLLDATIPDRTGTDDAPRQTAILPTGVPVSISSARAPADEADDGAVG